MQFGGWDLDLFSWRFSPGAASQPNCARPVDESHAVTAASRTRISDGDVLVRSAGSASRRGINLSHYGYRAGAVHRIALGNRCAAGPGVAAHGAWADPANGRRQANP